MNMEDSNNIDRVEPLAGGRGQFFVNGYRIYKNPNESCWHVEKDGKECANFESKAVAKQWALAH